MSLQAHDVHACIGHKNILHGISLSARAGEVTAIVGPNGSGKSTLLKAITAEVDFTGRVEINGMGVAGMKPWALAGMRGVLAGLSGKKADIPERALQTVGLSGYESRFYQELSGGEQQRAQLARVLCQVWQPEVDGVPRWLLLDEPVASLDIGHQLLVMRLLQDYARRGGGVIAVMHDLNLSAMIADRMALVVGGRMLASGAPGIVMQDDLLSQAYGCPLRVNTAPRAEQSFLLPHMAGVA